MDDYNILTNDGHCADYVPHKAIKKHNENRGR